MRLNPVARGDLRVRLTSPKALGMLTVYLGILAALAFISLPPDLGRLDDLRQEGLLLAFLIVETVLAAYLTSAPACGEIAVEGEKSVWDLAASPFPSGVIARGKVMTSAAFATLLVILATPFMVIVAGIRGESLAGVVRAAGVAIPVAAALGSLGSLYAAVYDSDFARSFVHWLTLLAVIVGATALPSPWDGISPVRMVIVAVRDGFRPEVLAADAAYVIVGSLTILVLSRRIARIRAEARAA